MLLLWFLTEKMLYVDICLAPKKKIFFRVRNMERLSTLKVSFGTLDVDTVPAAKKVLFRCSMVFFNFMECILLIQQRHLLFCPKDH